jgi:hypothetical protein
LGADLSETTEGQMNEPRFDTSDWFTAIFSGLVAGILAGISAFALFFTNSKARIYERITKVEESLADMDDRHQLHHAQLIELRANQVNTCERLSELKLLQKEHGAKLENKLDDLMEELRTKT